MGLTNPLHLAFIAAIALIVLGPKRLPDVARSLGHGMREFREALQGASRANDEADEPDAVGHTTGHAAEQPGPQPAQSVHAAQSGQPAPGAPPPESPPVSESPPGGAAPSP